MLMGLLVIEIDRLQAGERRFISNNPSLARFFPTWVMRQWNGRDFSVGDQFLSRVFRRQWWWRGLFCARGEIFRKFIDKTLGGPGAGFSEGTDGAAGNVISYRFQSRWILHHAAAEQHSDRKSVVQGKSVGIGGRRGTGIKETAGRV